MTQKRAREILRILQGKFTKPAWITSNMDPFKTLIITIISQNTNDKNALKAFEKLSKTVGVAPEILAKVDTAKIEECLKIAGLYRNKAKVIREVSRIILEEYGGSLKPILEMPFDEARKALMKLPGVGTKTADVVLLFSAGKPTIPIDTHVNRVSKRLGLAPKNGGYEEVRGALQSLFNPEEYVDAHILLILLGRSYCRAKNPLCQDCPVNTLCPSMTVN